MITLANFRQTALAGDGEIRLAAGGKSLEVVKDGFADKVKWFFGGSDNGSARRDVRFAFVNAVRKSGGTLNAAALRRLGLAEDSKIADSARSLTCRTVRGLLGKVGGVERTTNERT